MLTLTRLTVLTQLTRQLDQSWRDTGQDPLAGPPIELITKDGSDGNGLNRHSYPANDAYTATNPAQTASTLFKSGGPQALAYGSSYYWTSSEDSTTNAWAQDYRSSTPGYQATGTKNYSRRVRAVRRSLL